MRRAFIRADITSCDAGTDAANPARVRLQTPCPDAAHLGCSLRVSGYDGVSANATS